MPLPASNNAALRRYLANPPSGYGAGFAYHQIASQDRARTNIGEDNFNYMSEEQRRRATDLEYITSGPSHWQQQAGSNLNRLDPKKPTRAVTRQANSKAIQRRRRGRASTILTSSRGVKDSSNTMLGYKTLLGR